MAKSRQSFNKNEKEKKRLKKKKEKLERKEARKSEQKDSSLENMMVYVDADGNLVDSPPDEQEKEEEIKAEDIVLGIPKKEKTEPEVHEGKVSYFDHSKGFGFIQGANKHEKYFVHMSKCIDEIEEGDTVTFDVENGMKGLDAVNVKLK